MSEIDRVLSRAARRLWIGSALQASVRGLALAGVALVLMRGAQKLVAFGINWTYGALLAAGLGLLYALVWSIATRPSRLHVARVVDQGAGLRESLSTAICVRQVDDPWSRAAVDQATAVASRVVLRDAVPITPPRWWPAPLALALAFFLVGLLPQGDLIKLITGEKKVAGPDAEVIKAAQAEVDTAKKEVKEALSKVKDEDLKKQLEEPPEPPKEPQTPEEIKLEAMKELTQLDDRLNQLKSGDNAQELQELNNRLQELKQPAGPETEITKMTQALQRGDAAGAKKHLEAMQKKLESGQMTPEQKQAIDKQAQDLAKQLEKMAGDRQELEKKLEEAGLDKKLASDPEALKKALEGQPGMSEPMKKLLQQQATSTSGACEKLGKMAAACNNPGESKDGKPSQAGKQGQSGKQGGSGKGSGKPMGDMGDQLSEMEMAQEQLNSVSAAQQSVKIQLEKMGGSMAQSAGDKNGSPNDMGNAFRKGGGRADGGRQRAADADFDLNKEKVKGQLQNGPIIGTTLMEGGEQIKGESKKQFADAVEKADKAATEAIDNKTIPREYHDAVKNYFGRLQKKAGNAPTSAPAPAPAQPPAPDAKPATPTPAPATPDKK